MKGIFNIEKWLITVARSCTVPECPHLHVDHDLHRLASRGTVTSLSCTHDATNSSQCHDRVRRAEMGAKNNKAQIFSFNSATTSQMCLI